MFLTSSRHRPRSSICNTMPRIASRRKLILFNLCVTLSIICQPIGEWCVCVFVFVLVFRLCCVCPHCGAEGATRASPSSRPVYWSSMWRFILPLSLTRKCFDIAAFQDASRGGGGGGYGGGGGSSEQQQQTDSDYGFSPSAGPSGGGGGGYGGGGGSPAGDTKGGGGGGGKKIQIVYIKGTHF